MVNGPHSHAERVWERVGPVDWHTHGLECLGSPLRSTFGRSICTWCVNMAGFILSLKFNPLCFALSLIISLFAFEFC